MASSAVSAADKEALASVIGPAYNGPATGYKHIFMPYPQACPSPMSRHCVHNARMEPALRILAVILAGGLARRMEGACKPLLALGGRRLIDLVAENARGQGLDVVLNLHALTRRQHRAVQEPRPAFRSPMRSPGHAGPLAGILAGLDEAARKNFDARAQPALRHAVPAARSRATAGGRGKNLACAASGGRVHPVIALWPVALRENLRRALIDERIRAPKDFQRRHDGAVVEWPVVPRDPFFNVNTPADLGRGGKAAGASTTSGNSTCAASNARCPC